MKCYYHNDRDAVSQCRECGRGLCKECTDRHNKPLCEECGKEIFVRKQEEFKREFDKKQEENKRRLILSKKSAGKWVTASFIAMFFFIWLFYSILRETDASVFSSPVAYLFVICFGAYMGLVITMGTRRCFRSAAVGLLAMPVIGWTAFLIVWAFFMVFACFVAIPDFITLLRAATKKIDK